MFNNYGNEIFEGGLIELAGLMYFVKISIHNIILQKKNQPQKTLDIF